jgi:hypothetical protein
MANKKVTELTAVTAATANDVVYIVANTAGTAVSRKITVNNLNKYNSVSANTTGTANASITSANYQANATSLDVNKGVQVLDAGSTTANKHFYLPDGLEGQVMYFVTKESTHMDKIYVWMDNIRVHNQAGILTSGIVWIPFPTSKPRTVATAVFAAGAWNIDSNDYD